MRKLTPVRKKLAVMMATVFVATSAITMTAAPVSASPGGSPGKHRIPGSSSKASTGASLGPEDSAKSQLPAPPRPPQKVPTARLAKTGQTGNATKQPKTGVTQTLTDLFSAVKGAATTNTTAATGVGAPGSPSTTKTLVVYDHTGPYAWLGEDYGIAAVNLVSHFGGWTAHPVDTYKAGELAGYTAVVYVGSTYDEPIPVAFLDDVLASTKPVIWMYDNIWQLTARSADFSGKYGWTYKGFDFSEATTVSYKGVALTRDKLNAPSGLMDYVITDPTKVTTVATAVRPDGTSMPWAVRSRKPHVHR